MLVTVFGGTGFMGRRIVRALLATGVRVRVVARHPGKLPALVEPDLAEPFAADVTDDDSVAAALEGAGAAVNAVSLYVEKPGLSFDDIHVAGARRVATLAGQAGVARLVHVSGIGSDPDDPSRYISARGRGEVVVREAFRQATLVRPSVLFGKGDAFLTTILKMVRRAPIQPLFGRGDTRLQPVHVGDIGAAMARLATRADAKPVYEFGGPDILTYRQIVELAARHAGVRARPVQVPFPIWQGIASIAERLPGAPITRDQVALMRRDNVTSPGMPGLDALGIAPRSVDEALHNMVKA